MSINYIAINKSNYFVKEFYKGESINFQNITDEKISLLKKKSLTYNEIYKNTKGSKLEKYIKIMEMHKLSKIHGLFNDDTEKLICFMFSIDPDFEIIKIVNEFNKVSEVKMEIINKFGVFDINMIRLQKYYINHFLPKEEKEKLDEEIEKRIWK